MNDMSHVKRTQCVSNCLVPLCSTLQCGYEETCILSSQTCDSCPKVSCVSLTLTTTSGAQGSHDSFPKGAIAGIVIVVLLLLVALSYLLVRLHKRRKILASVHEKSGSIVEEAAENYVGRSSPDNSDFASIRIRLGSGVPDSVVESSSTSLPPALGDHFFSADELMRMSYAESSRGSIKPRNTQIDTGAAIIQSNKPVIAVRAKAAVLKFTKHASPASMSPNPSAASTPDTTTQQNRLQQVQGQSVWEDDESVLDSPIERDMISPNRLSSGSRDSQLADSKPRRSQPTSPLAQSKNARTGRSLTDTQAPPPFSSTVSQKSSEVNLPVMLREPVLSAGDAPRPSIQDASCRDTRLQE